MELGISALGHIIEMGLSQNFTSLVELLFKSSEECLKFAEHNGIKIVELVLEPPEVFNNDQRHKFIELMNSYSITKQLHSPFVDVNLCSHNNYISNASIKSYIETVKICCQIDVNIMTIHPGYANFMLSSIREFNKKALKLAIHKLLDFTNNRNLNICLENMPRNANIMTDDKNITEVYNIIDREDLFLTYDTSHYYTCDGNVEHLWEKFHRIIKNIHIVDNFSKESDTHPPLGSGKINFKEIFNIIKSYNYDGPLIIELSSAKSLNQSINFINKFL